MHVTLDIMKVTLVLLCTPLTRVCARDSVMGYSVGRDIVLALQRVRVLGDGGQRLRSINDLKVIETRVALNLITLGTENLESAPKKF